MTVIVADTRLGLIGSDRFCTSGYYSRKVYKTKKMGIFACAGDDRAISRFEAWMLHNGDRPHQIPEGTEEEFQALQLYRGSIYLWAVAMRPTFIDEDYYAIGSGGDLALGALDAGANMFRAMAIATRRTEGAKPPFEYMDEAGTIYTGEPHP